MPRGVPMAWMDDLYEHPPVWVVARRGRPFHRRRRPPYLDMYVADMSGFCGHAPAPVVEAVAPRGWSAATSSCCPARTRSPSPSTSPAATGCRSGSSRSSATQANTEVIRLAREMTGREVVLLFDGKYHGEGDATLVVLEDGEVVPEMPRAAAVDHRAGPGGPLQRRRGAGAALAPGDVALVLAEPAMTNAGFLLPEPGFHDALRRADARARARCSRSTRRTRSSAPTAASRGDGGSSPTSSSLGKSIAAGVPLAAYGMSDEIAALIAPPEESRVVSGVVVDEVATGGTLFGTRSRWRRGAPP